MDYPQILAPVLNFLQCPTPQAWIDKARDPANLPLLLTDHMVCELKAAQTALLLVRKYVADESGADALLDWLKPVHLPRRPGAGLHRPAQADWQKRDAQNRRPVGPGAHRQHGAAD